MAGQLIFGTPQPRGERRFAPRRSGEPGGFGGEAGRMRSERRLARGSPAASATKATGMRNERRYAAASGASATKATGMRNENVVPLPISLSTQIVPPWRTMISRLM